MAGTLTRKPPAAKIRMGRMSAPLEVVLAATLPVLPHRQVSRVSTSLARANPVYWAPVCERRESAAAVMESKLDVRGFVRTAPVMDVGMSVIPPQGWDLTRHVPRQSIPMIIPDAISPGKPVLWNAAPRPFTGSVASLGEWAAVPFSPIKLAGEVAGETQPRKPNVRILAPEKPASTQAEPQPADPLAQPVPQLDLGPQTPRASPGRSSSKILTLFGGSQE